jgi:hypothetical protein
MPLLGRCPLVCRGAKRTRFVKVGRSPFILTLISRVLFAVNSVQNMGFPKEFAAKFPVFLPLGAKMAASADKGKLAGVSHSQMRHPVIVSNSCMATAIILVS